MSGRRASSEKGGTAPGGEAASGRRRLRLRALRELLRIHGEVGLAEACAELRASPASLRRDFVRLAREPGIERTWGGLRLRPDAPRDPGGMVPFGDRLTRALVAKQAIAAAAVALVAPGDTVLIDGGTTTLQMAPHLAGMRVRVITNSIGVAHRIEQERRGRLGAETHLTGGMLYPESHLLVGPAAVAALAGGGARWAFLSTAALDASGATNDNALVVETERAMIARAERLVVLCDHTKFGRRALVPECALEEIDVLVTDEAPPAALARALRRAGVEVRTSARR